MNPYELYAMLRNTMELSAAEARKEVSDLVRAIVLAESLEEPDDNSDTL